MTSDLSRMFAWVISQMGDICRETEGRISDLEESASDLYGHYRDAMFCLLCADKVAECAAAYHSKGDGDSWLKLENAIKEYEDAKKQKHIDTQEEAEYQESIRRCVKELAARRNRKTLAGKAVAE